MGAIHEQRGQVQDTAGKATDSDYVRGTTLIILTDICKTDIACMVGHKLNEPGALLKGWYEVSPTIVPKTRATSLMCKDPQ